MSAVASRWKSRASLRAWLALLLAGVVATAAARAAELAPRTETFPGDYQSLRLTAGAVWPNPDAKAKAGGVLRKADAYTERTQKGAKTYYRARFAGFDRDEAEAACKQLKRSDLACMALKI